MIVRVPASSANLGPGFDCFGLAWELYNEIEFALTDGPLEISGCDARYQNADNLSCRAFRRAVEAAGKSAPGLRIRFLDCEIPVSRGLGSSAALIAGGVLAADRLCGLGLSREELFEIATEIEGHPDNVAPALFGGLTVSAMDGKKPVFRSFPVSGKLRFAVLIPPFELSTAKARAVLPATVGRADAIFNVARGALLLHALGEGDAALLPLAMEDRIHQPYRLPLIEGFETARAAAADCGAAGFCISGAGSTLLCVSDEESFAARLERRMAAALPGWRVRAVRPDAEGAVILD